jgi:hypothetical protein
MSSGQVRRLRDVRDERGAPSRVVRADASPSTDTRRRAARVPATARSTDDFPAPFGPIRQTHSPSRTAS